MGSVEKHGKGLLNEGAFSHKHLRWQMQCFASEMGKTGTEIVSHILDKRKGRKLTIYGSL